MAAARTGEEAVRLRLPVSAVPLLDPRLHQYLEEEGLLLAPSKSKVLCACEEIGRLTERTLNAEKEMELGPGMLGITNIFAEKKSFKKMLEF